MNLNLQIIKNNLKSNTIISSKITNRKELNILGIKIMQSSLDEASKEHIYITTYDWLTRCHDPGIFDSVIVLIGAGQSISSKESFVDIPNILFISDDISIMDLFCRITEIFEKYNLISTKLLEALAKNADIKDLINIGCHLFSNPIIFLDTAFTAICYSRKEDGGYSLLPETWPSILNTGHVSQHSMDYWVSNKDSLSLLNSKAADFHSIDTDLYLSIRINIFSNGKRIGRLIIPNDYAPLEDGHLSLAEWFSKVLTLYYDRQILENKLSNSSFEQFLEHIINGYHYDDTAIIEKFLSIPGWNIEDHYILLNIELQNKLQPIDTLYFSLPKIQKLFSKSFYLKCDMGGICLINVQQALSIDDPAYSRLKKLLAEYGLRASVSLVFHDIRDMYQHFIFTRRAHELRDIMDIKQTIIFYKDILVQDLCSLVAMKMPEFPIMDLCLPEIQKLYLYDQKNQTDFFITLFEYLLNGQSLVHTAQKLHIHRNTLVYRISKINDLTQLDFHDNELRILAFLSCHLIMYQNKILRTDS